MANLLTMADIQAILGLHERGWRQRRIARELDVDRETVAKYVRASGCVPKPAKAPLCKRRSETVARDGACVTVEKRGALEPTRGRVSKACNGTTATSLTPPRGSRECTRTWNCGAKCVAGC